MAGIFSAAVVGGWSMYAARAACYEEGGISSVIQEAVREISGGISEIDRAIDEVSGMSETNRQAISDINREVGVFLLKA